MRRAWALILAGLLGFARSAAADEGDQTACLKGKKRDACRRAIAEARKAHDTKLEPELLARACDLGDGAACGARAEFAPDMATAAQYRKKGCKANDMTSCELYGKQLRAGEGVAQNVAAGTKLLVRACKGKAGGACRALALDHPKGPKYVELLKQACDGGDRWVACVMVGDLYARGDRVKPNLQTATKYYTMACETGLASACAKAGTSMPDNSKTR